uniref:Uncharacterized protein n=1 Tax=Trichobilharzia regenti TaxID=157069 RepID=A0AA85K657_TRIRE|nr:unnamed protein product [Trichobilharzia regenti]
MRRKDDDAVLPKSYALPESNATNLNSSSKVIKSTARSTWDSSDSDFDSTVVRTEKASESENTIPVYNHTSNLSNSSRKTSHSTANKLSSSKESKSIPTTKRKNDTCSKDGSVNSKEARSKLSSSDSDNRRREKTSNRQRSSKRRRKSIIFCRTHHLITLGSELLSHVILPYPTMSLKANVDALDDIATKQPCTLSNGILRTEAYAPNRHMTEGSLLTG